MTEEGGYGPAFRLKLHRAKTFLSYHLLQLCFLLHPDILSTPSTGPFPAGSLLRRPSSDTKRSPETNMKLHLEILRTLHSKRFRFRRRVGNVQFL